MSPCGMGPRQGPGSGTLGMSARPAAEPRWLMESAFGLSPNPLSGQTDPDSKGRPRGEQVYPQDTMK